MVPDRQKILTKIYKYCAYQDRCTSEVSQKLLTLGLPREELEDMLLHLENERFVDNERFAHSFVRGRFTYKQWGRHKIRQALKAKAISTHLIEKALTTEISSLAYRNVIQKLVEKKSRQWEKLSSLEKKDKTIRFLLQKGFEWEEIMEEV